MYKDNAQDSVKKLDEKTGWVIKRSLWSHKSYAPFMFWGRQKIEISYTIALRPVAAAFYYDVGDAAKIY